MWRQKRPRGPSLFDRATRARVANDDWRDTSRSIVYSPLHGSVFFLNSGVSPTDLNKVSVSGGVLGGEIDSPYHGDYSLPNPIRILPSTYRPSLGLTFNDVAFHASKIQLVDTVGSNTQLRTLDSGFTILGARWFPGTAKRIFEYGEELVLVTENGGATEVRILAP